MNKSYSYGLTTQLVHADRKKSIEHGSVHKPVHNSVLYGYSDVRELIEVFQGRQAGYRYGRQGNPTVSALEDKITLMEEGVGSIAFASGMAAIAGVLQGLLRDGDHIVSSQFLFGNTNSVWNTLGAQGFDITQVDATQVEHVERALRPNTRMVFVETIANPRTQVSDLEGIGRLCREKGILFVVDSTMTSPYVFKAKAVGAGLVLHSLTKAIAGHGNVLGGSVTDTGVFDWTQFPHILEVFRKQPAEMQALVQIRTKGLRDFGACLSPDAAHQISVGAETLVLRQERACANSLALARQLEADPRVQKVYYPGLESHPEYARAKSLFKYSGTMLSFELKPEVDTFDYLNRLKLAIAATHLGDNRTLVIPVAHTIFFEAGAAKRAEMGIADSLVRVSVGIEETEDLLHDFSQAFE